MAGILIAKCVTAWGIGIQYKFNCCSINTSQETKVFDHCWKEIYAVKVYINAILLVNLLSLETISWHIIMLVPL